MNKGYLFVLITALISGFSIFISKQVVSGLNPYAFTFLKNVIVALLLVSIIGFMGNYSYVKKLSRNQWGQLVTIGLVGGSIPFLLFFKGLSMTSAANAAFIHKTMFIWVGLLAFIFLKEKLSKGAMIGAILLLAGNLVFLSLNSFTIGAGELMVFAATLFWAAENTLSKHALKSIRSNIVAAGRMGFGSMFILIFLLATGNMGNVAAALTSRHVLGIILTSTLLLGYVMTWYKGLSMIKASTATSILLLGSPITALLNFSILKKALTLNNMIGAILIVAGVLSFIGWKRIIDNIAGKSPVD